MLGNRWRGRPVAIAALSALLVAGCARPASEPDDGAREVATRFLDELRSGRIEPAWQGTSAEFKSIMGLENLRDYVKAHPALGSPASYSETRIIDRNGLTLAECVFQAQAKPGGQPSAGPIKVLLAEGDEGWTVEHLAVE